MQVKRAEQGSRLAKQLAEYARNCSWVAGGHLAMLLEEKRLTDWETAFVLMDEEDIWGFCTLMKTDYYPEKRYSPWISTVFVDEQKRGERLSGMLVEAAAAYAKEIGFETAYIPSDMLGFYEKYGFEKMDELKNYGGDVDHIFARKL